MTSLLPIPRCIHGSPWNACDRCPSLGQLGIQLGHLLSPARAHGGLEHEDGEAAAEVGGLFCGHESTVVTSSFDVFISVHAAALNSFDRRNMSAHVGGSMEVSS